MNKAYFEELAAYNNWADNKAISWLSGITDEQWDKVNASSFNSVKQTAIHIASAEKIWIDFWTGVNTPVYLSSVFTGSKAELMDIWQKASRGIVDFVNGHPEADLEKTINFIYPNGRIGEIRYFQSFAHCINHSTYHRGQLVTLLRQVGFSDFSSVDLATYYVSQNATANLF
ncbi:DinB family protein [Mucilaginibacter sp. CAU 1740]|uniref:DinB family protein n=1 Tax=Mucilaginibacter sp. CAU 1740 TaxID=3140365 RepID=UPI00325BC152